MSIPYYIEKDHGMRPSPMTRAHRMRQAQKERRSTLRAVAVGLMLLALAGIGIWLLIRSGR